MYHTRVVDTSFGRRHIDGSLVAEYCGCGGCPRVIAPVTCGRRQVSPSSRRFPVGGLGTAPIAADWSAARTWGSGRGAACPTSVSVWPQFRGQARQVVIAKPLATAGRTFERSAGTCRAGSTAERRPPTPPSNERPGKRTGNYPLTVRVTASATNCRWTLSSPRSSRKLAQASAPRASRRQDAQVRNSRGCLTLLQISGIPRVFWMGFESLIAHCPLSQGATACCGTRQSQGFLRAAQVTCESLRPAKRAAGNDVSGPIRFPAHPESTTSRWWAARELPATAKRWWLSLDQ